MPIGLSSFASTLWAGDASLALAGSETAQPPGLEALLEYNGLIMHDRAVVDKYRVKSISGLHSVDIRDNRELNPQNHGETPFDSYLGGRTILISGSIEAGNISKLRDMQQALRTAFYVFQEKPLIFRTGTIDRDIKINCRLFDKIAMEETQSSQEPQRDFQISLRASSPYFESLVEHVASHDFGSVSGAISASGILRLTNAGNALSAPKIRIYGPVTGAKLTNDTLVDDEQAPRSIIINGSIPAGRYYEYDGHSGESATLYDDLGANKIGQLAVESDDIRLAPGQNQFTFLASDSSGSTPAVEISYNDTWL